MRIVIHVLHNNSILFLENVIVFTSQELVLPLTLAARNFEGLRRWDDPLVTASFLGLVYTVIFR